MTNDGSTNLGNSVGPVGSCSVREMKVTNDRREKQGRNRKQDQRGQHRKGVDEIVGELNHTMQAMKKRIAFSIVTEGRTRVLQVTDMDNDTVIRKFPLDDQLSAEQMKDVLGVLVDKNG